MGYEKRQAQARRPTGSKCLCALCSNRKSLIPDVYDTRAFHRVDQCRLGSLRCGLATTGMVTSIVTDSLNIQKLALPFISRSIHRLSFSHCLLWLPQLHSHVFVVWLVAFTNRYTSSGWACTHCLVCFYYVGLLHLLAWVKIKSPDVY